VPSAEEVRSAWGRPDHPLRGGPEKADTSRERKEKNILACLANRPPATIRMLSTWTFPEQLGSLPSKKCGRSNRSRSLSGPGSAPQEVPILNACNLACRRYFGVLVPLVRRVCRPLPHRSMTLFAVSLIKTASGQRKKKCLCLIIIYLPKALISTFCRFYVQKNVDVDE